MNDKIPERCPACGVTIRGLWYAAGASTTVWEDDKRIVLLHCPRCATLLVRMGRKRATVG